jgi:hypothetical protein
MIDPLKTFGSLGWSLYLRRPNISGNFEATMLLSCQTTGVLD